MSEPNYCGCDLWSFVNRLHAYIAELEVDRDVVREKILQVCRKKDEEIGLLKAKLVQARTWLAEANEHNGHREPCYYCGKLCNILAANPGEWPIPLCHADDPGVVKFHHAGCVSERLARIDAIEREARNGR